jgi:hypothetical protein
MIRRVSWVLGGPQPLKLIPNDIESCRTIGVVGRNYFTNTDLMKKDDPYATLGIHWGATTTEIKAAFKQKARKLHPDVNKTDSAEEALKKFQTVQKAYSALMDVKGAPHRDDLLEEWSFAVWRNSDMIAENRDDVAGALRQKPIQPAQAAKPGSKWGMALGHPTGGGNKPRRAEYIGAGNASNGPRTNTVGTGQSKWVTKKKYEPWKNTDKGSLK